MSNLETTTQDRFKDWSNKQLADAILDKCDGLARRAEAGEVVALRAEEFLDQLEKRWPEVTDMDEWRDALLQSISEMRLLP